MPWHHQPSSTCSRNDYGSGGSLDNRTLASLAIPPLLARATTVVEAVWMTVPWYHRQIVACSRDYNDSSCADGMDNSALASPAIPACSLNDNNDSSGGADDGALVLLAVPCLLTQTVAAAAVRMMVPWHCQPSLASSCDGNDGDGADNGALALSAIPACLLDDNDGSVLFGLQEAPASKIL